MTLEDALLVELCFRTSTTSLLTMLATLWNTTASASLRSTTALLLPASRRNLSYKEKQKRKMPAPRRFVRFFVDFVCAAQ